jgi:hypothetical protein
MDQFPLITSLQERDRKKKAAGAEKPKTQDINNKDENVSGEQKSGKGGETILGKMGKTFDKYAENATEHYEDKGMRMKPHWL